MIDTYVYVNLELVGDVTITQRLNVNLGTSAVLDMQRALNELHRLTGVRPSDMALALPTEAIQAIRSDARFSYLSTPNFGGRRAIAHALGVRATYEVTEK
jgi:hypothetical protein